MPLFLTKIGPPNGPYYTYPNRAEYEESVEGRALSSDTPLRAGRHSRGSRPNGRRIQASGVLQSPGAYPASNLQALMEAFRAAHRAFDSERGDPVWHELFLQDGGSGASAGETRILRVTNLSLTLSVKKPLNRAPWKVSYEADDPYLYAAAPVTTVLATNGSVTPVTNPGSAWCYPVLSLTLTRSAAGAVLVTNARNGLAFSLTPDAAGGYSAFGGMDATGKAEQILKNGSVDAFGMADGEFLELEPGINGLKVVTSGGVTATSASVSFVPRYE